VGAGKHQRQSSDIPASAYLKAGNSNIPLSLFDIGSTNNTFSYGTQNYSAYKSVKAHNTNNINTGANLNKALAAGGGGSLGFHTGMAIGGGG
jgi:hypothetical protein